VASLYVGGPVLRQDSAPPLWTKDVYLSLYTLAEQQRATILLPEGDGELETMQPEAFYAEMDSRIRSSAAGIILFAAPNASAAVEATMLALAGKPQIIVAENSKDVPRLVRGLPGVARVVGVNEGYNVFEAVGQFIDRHLNG
jgi:hypothetical protein